MGNCFLSFSLTRIIHKKGNCRQKEDLVIYSFFKFLEELTTTKGITFFFEELTTKGGTAFLEELPTNGGNIIASIQYNNNAV